ncbi:DUF2092 domain-containing protein [Azospirillum rugosum]|uniref:DUF2092 domain-containing protein n=1 Tax=Azospirillum rugosum TaxID=416170 RepID=A0ABS4STD9_9PROT|nr:DUF2092 domain-containing protein [Azospirillum rugosum]MBP2295805.1 hypothetical protein [Azospirillum rugosum]MDQ0529084.1 hypothetical protein [Azospirillum rugosum]
MRTLLRLSGPLLCLPLLFGPALAVSQVEGADTDDEPAIDEQVIDEHAKDVLNRMADTLAQAKGFSVTIRSNYDVVQDTGEKIEFGERRTVTLNRPDALRVESRQSDGTRRQVTFDGKALTVFDPGQNVYGQLDRPGSVDDAVRYLVQDLQIRLPLALLLVTTLPAELDQRIQALDYVEHDTLTPVPTDHVAGRTEDVDFQVWVAADGTPLPQRITITYKNDEGEPQYRADLTDWTLNPDLSAAQLAFRPPDGAQRIPFLVRVRKSVGDQPGSQDHPERSGSAEEAPK